MFSALDAAGHVGDATLTDVDGAFRLTLPNDFEVERFRLSRIGYATRYFTNAEVVPRTAAILRIDSAPIQLPEVNVRADRQCSLDPGNASVIQTFWNQARTSLEITDLSQRGRIASYTLAQSRRILEPRRNRVLSDTTVSGEVNAETPYRTLTVEQMTAAGWVETTSSGASIFYAPDARLLLSPAFARQHCFSLAAADDELRIAFTPNRSRASLPEISGFFALDRKTSELTELHFRYVGGSLPTQEERQPYGEIHFLALPSGPRFVREWFIRVPVTELSTAGSGMRQRVAHIVEEAGRVDEVVLEESDYSLGPLREPVLADTARSRVDGLAVEPSYRMTELGVELYIRNEGSSPVEISSVRLAECSNVGGTCGMREGRTIVPSGSNQRVATILRRELLEPIDFLWSYDVSPAADQPRDTESHLRIRIVDAESRAAIENARVYLPSLERSALTDANGVARFPAESSGASEVRAEALGYAPTSLPISRPSSDGDLVIEMLPAAIPISGVTATADRSSARRSPRLLERGFYARSRTGLGTHLDLESIESRSPTVPSDLFRSIAGVRVQSVGGHPLLTTGRGFGGFGDDGQIAASNSQLRALQSATGGADPEIDGCPLEIRVDGTSWSGLVDDLPMEWIAGIEVYPSATELPAGYSATTTACGLILVWTR